MSRRAEGVCCRKRMRDTSEREVQTRRIVGSGGEKKMIVCRYTSAVAASASCTLTPCGGKASSLVRCAEFAVLANSMQIPDKGRGRGD
ncbi:hypothetical protein TNCV_4621781 [Trichonephila clavipes]|nr:hypothetical protein TNCV_4621781 [Trichonephila clavipes]